LEGVQVTEYVCARTPTRPRWNTSGRTAKNIGIGDKGEEGRGRSGRRPSGEEGKGNMH